MNQKIAFSSRFNKKEIAGCILLIAVCVLPFFTFAHTKKIHVDADAKGEMDGSSDHPYKKIGDALKHAKKGTEIDVAKGIYDESIVIPKGVTVVGSDKYDVVIDGNKNKSVVEMEDNSKLIKVTVKDGRYGVEVGKNDEALILKCSIKENEKGGIKINGGAVDKKDGVSIIESEINSNDGVGIYAEKRKIVLMDNQIMKNDHDGVIIEAGSNAWIERNYFNKNEGSGIKMTLDGSSITVKKNKIRGNLREGIEINAFGAKGSINIFNSKFWENKRYAIARVLRGNASSAVWSGVKTSVGNTFWATGIGNVSPIIRVN